MNVIEIGKIRDQATVAEAIEQAVLINRDRKVKRIAILIRINDEEDDETLCFLVGKNGAVQYTNALLVWDLEQVKNGLFEGYFEKE